MPYPSYIGSNGIKYVGYMGPSINCMMTLSNGNIPALPTHFDGNLSVPKSSYAELWSFLWSAPKQTVEQAIETPLIWDTIARIMSSFECEIISSTLPVSVLQNYWKKNT